MAEWNIWVERAGQNLSHLTSDIKATYSLERNRCWESLLASTQHITVVRRARRAWEKLLGRSSPLGRRLLGATQLVFSLLSLSSNGHSYSPPQIFLKPLIEPLILFRLLCMNLTNDGNHCFIPLSWLQHVEHAQWFDQRMAVSSAQTHRGHKHVWHRVQCSIPT